MKKTNHYIAHITIKISAPRGYKPSTMTYRLALVANKNHEKLFEHKASEHANEWVKQLEEQNQGIKLTYTLKVNEVAPVFMIDKITDEEIELWKI